MVHVYTLSGLVNSMDLGPWPLLSATSSLPPPHTLITVSTTLHLTHTLTVTYYTHLLTHLCQLTPFLLPCLHTHVPVTHTAVPVWLHSFTPPHLLYSHIPVHLPTMPHFLLNTSLPGLTHCPRCPHGLHTFTTPHPTQVAWLWATPAFRTRVPRAFRFIHALHTRSISSPVLIAPQRCARRSRA